MRKQYLSERQLDRIVNRLVEMSSPMNRDLDNFIKDSEFDYKNYGAVYNFNTGTIDFIHWSHSRGIDATPFLRGDTLEITGKHNINNKPIDLGEYDLTRFVDRYDINKDNWFENEEFVDWYYGVIEAAVDEFEAIYEDLIRNTKGGLQHWVPGPDRALPSYLEGKKDI